MQQHGPWKIKTRETKYKNPWIEVLEDQVINPDGKPGIYGTVVMKPGVSILALDEKNNAYLISEFHYALGKDSIEVVSGGMDGDEIPLQAAKRELKEESGIEAKEWVDLGRIDPFTSAIDSPAYLFLARGLTFGERTLEGSEVINIIKIPFDKAIHMVMESEITHGPSCVLILKAKKFLNTI